MVIFLATAIRHPMSRMCGPRRMQATTVPAMTESPNATHYSDAENYYDAFGDYWDDTFYGDEDGYSDSWQEVAESVESQGEEYRWYGSTPATGAVDDFYREGKKRGKNKFIGESKDTTNDEGSWSDPGELLGGHHDVLILRGKGKGAPLDGGKDKYEKGKGKWSKSRPPSWMLCRGKRKGKGDGKFKRSYNFFQVPPKSLQEDSCAICGRAIGPERCRETEGAEHNLPCDMQPRSEDKRSSGCADASL